MNITLTKLKHVKSQSRETHCFTAIVNVDGKPLCYAENSGHGGCDNYHPIEGKHTINELHHEIKDIDDELGKEILDHGDFQIPNSLEIVVSELINDAVTSKELKSLMKRRVAYFIDGSIMQLAAKVKPSADTFARVKRSPWWTPNHQILAELPFEDALKIFRGE